MSSLFTLPWTDILALAIFAVTWVFYALVVDHGPWSHRTLSAAMNRQRAAWVQAMLGREVRIADTAILGGLQQGTAFFASASMLAIGACLALLGSGAGILGVLRDIVPFESATPAVFELKVFGLTVIFVYAFFKFGWSYRIFNYASILVGALPPASECDTPQAAEAAARTITFIRLGGQHFNRGQRAFNFSIPFLGWLAGPWVLIAGTLLTVIVLLRRQFLSESAKAIADAGLPSG